MKRVFIIASLLTIISAFSATAQVKSYISLYGGFSTPTGVYGSNNYYNNQAAFANKGITFGVDGAVYFFKNPILQNLGLGYIFSFQDQGKINYNNTYILAQGYTASYNSDETDVSSYDRFHNFNLLIGPQYSYTYHNFILDLRVSAGVIDVTSTPETEIQLYGIPEQTDPYYERRSHGYAFGYGGSAGLRYKLGDSWSFGIKAAYISSDGTPQVINGQAYVQGRVATQVAIKEIQTTMGFSLNF